ncbi:MAG: WG repeat-containing protein [Capnocytophaga sp.]|nr:WG repeat-containing protein [Capnocytophaga sp.]
MKLRLLILALGIVSFSVFGQADDFWTAFYNKDSTLIGYKDKNEKVKITPKFEPFIIANKFEHIIAAIEKTNDGWEYYYLTKDGKIVGRDSLYIFDNTPDCENEGFIRFRDRQTDKAGMLDRNGNIAIPAIYDDLFNVRNGMVIVLKNSKKELHGGHYFRTGGQTMLIDTLHNVLIEDFSLKNYATINLYAVEKTKTPHTDSIRQSFLAKDGSYYSFIDFEKEFHRWITNELSSGLTQEQLYNMVADSVVWNENNWKKLSKETLVKEKYKIINDRLSKILNSKTEYFISLGGLNAFIFEGEEYSSLFDNCRNPKYWQFPTVSIIINREKRQEHYEFLRTDHGYKLIQVSK